MIMLKRFEVKNYKNFKERIVIDFSKVGGYQFNLECITNQLLSKMIIYGRNASGKTNLGFGRDIWTRSINNIFKTWLHVDEISKHKTDSIIKEGTADREEN